MVGYRMFCHFPVPSGGPYKIIPCPVLGRGTAGDSEIIREMRTRIKVEI